MASNYHTGSARRNHVNPPSPPFAKEGLGGFASCFPTKITEKARYGEALNDVFIFDCHGHIGPSFIHHIPGNDAASMVKSMDRLGVDIVCLSGHASIMADHREGNNLVADAVRMFPDRIIGYACYNPHYGEEEAFHELARCFDALHFKAVKIHPQFHSYPANGPGYKPAWEFAARKGCPLLTHTLGGDPNCTPKLFGPLARDFPQVPLLVGHAGNNLAGVEEAIEVCKKYDNVFLDLNYSTLHYGVVEYLVQQLGVEKLAFGSDVSWNSLSYSLGIVLYARISDADKEKILGKTIAPLFNVDSIKFFTGPKLRGPQ